MAASIAIAAQPLALDAWDASAAWQRRLTWITWGFVALGIWLRVARYLLRFPLWGDECMLGANFLDRDWLGLMQPLDGRQVAPLGFLWLELATVKLLGFSEWSLRLWPTLFSVASVPLFWQVARRLTTGVPLAAAVGIFAVSYYPLRHGAELKPYGGDLCLALVLLALAIEWWREPWRLRWGWALTAAAPLAVALSYPAAFVGGGVSLALAPSVWRRRHAGTWLAFAAFNVLLVSAFAALYLAAGHAQATTGEQVGLHEMWRDGFPPLAEPWRLPLWLLDAHTGRMLAYPIGGPRGASAATTLCCLAGACWLWRARRRTWLALLLAPLGLGLLGAAVGGYPYGASARTMQYAAPAICLLAGLGAAWLIGRIAYAPWRWRSAAAWGCLLAALGLASGVRDLAWPYKTAEDRNTRAFNTWFWRDLERDAQLVCAVGDLGISLYDAERWRHGATDYRCYQRIYSPRHRHGPCPPQWESIAADHPLRCVVYRKQGLAPDPYALEAWLRDMQARYRLSACTTLPVNAGGDEPYEQWFDVYEFVPREGGVVAGRRDVTEPRLTPATSSR
jgi:hypothetical protein